MSRVFLAEETRLARRVVVKVLPPELAAEISVDRFNREIQLSASLQHPHIVPLLAAGGSADVLYYTMPFVEGEALRTRLAREGALPVRDAVRILKDVADALAYAHARGIVHRDIKPDNVLLSGSHAVVADFGVAKAVSQAKGQSGLTSVGVALGTPAYMAPEQAAGDPNIDHRADIYALGAMAYEMLAGQPPFSGLSPHQMLAAHITEPVGPITDARPSLPPALAELVMRCLEKNPPDRPQTAAEVYQVLDSLATTSGSATVTSARATLRHVLRRPRNRRIGVGVLFVVALAGGWVALRPPAGLALDPNRVAVAPFDVLGGGPELALWREGLVDVLSRSLDGAGPLRSASTTLIVRRWSGRADAASAQALGRATGAGTVIFGGLVQAGADSVRLTATILNVSDAASLGEIDLREGSERMDQLVDSLAVRVLRELGRTRAIGLVRSSSLGSPSLPALKAFLQGEQFLRRSEWDSALAYDQRAIGLDSGFVLAWSHAGMAAGWQHAAQDSLSRTYKLRAGALNHGLAPRESLIVQAESIAAVVYAGPGPIGGRWWTYGRRLVATLDEAVRRYPNDPELWYMLGDARFHAGGLAAVSSRTALDAFDRSIALDSAFTPSYVHAVPLGLELNGTESGRRYARAFLAAGAMGQYAQSTQLVLRVIDPATRAGAIKSLADSADAHLFQTVWLALSRWIDSAETTVAMMRARTAAQSAGPPTNFTVFALPVTLATRGHVREASARTTLPVLLAQFALVGGVPADSALRLARAWAARTGQEILYAAPLFAAQHDTAGLVSLTRTLEGMRQRPLPPNAPPIARDVFGYLTAASHAFLALARRDSAEALRLFDALPDTACFGACVIDDLVHIELLAARGRLADATTRLERPPVGFFPGLLPVEVLRALERGRVYERLGDRDRAVAGYSLVVDAWRDADPELKTYVDEARAALARLGGEKKTT